MTDLDLLISQYRDKPLIRALLAARVEAVEKLRETAAAVLAGLDVDTADEARLLLLGKIVGQPRRGQALETFRTFVKARIAAQRSRGRMPELLRIVRSLDPLGTVASYWPAGLRVDLRTSAALETLQAIRELVDLAVGAGIAAQVVAGDPEDAGAFAFGSDAFAEVPDGLGIDSDLSVGGTLAITLEP